MELLKRRPMFPEDFWTRDFRDSFFSKGALQPDSVDCASYEMIHCIDHLIKVRGNCVGLLNMVKQCAKVAETDYETLFGEMGDLDKSKDDVDLSTLEKISALYNSIIALEGKTRDILYLAELRVEHVTEKIQKSKSNLLDTAGEYTDSDLMNNYANYIELFCYQECVETITEKVNEYRQLSQTLHRIVYPLRYGEDGIQLYDETHHKE